MPLSRRQFFKGLAAVTTAAGIAIVTPRLLIPTDPLFAEEQTRLLSPPRRYWQGTGRLSPYGVIDDRAYLLSLTSVGQMVLYAEFLGIPKNLYPEMIATLRQGAVRSYGAASQNQAWLDHLAEIRAHAPDIDSEHFARATLAPRNWLIADHHDASTLARSREPIPLSEETAARIARYQQPYHVQQVASPDLWTPKK